jgi:hypothetical protein
MTRTTVLACLMIVALASPLCAQVSDKVELTALVIEEERESIISHALDLNDEEKKAFDPVYIRYRAEMEKLKDRLAELISDYSAQYGELSDTKAEEIMSSNLRLELEAAKVRLKYWDHFRKAVGPRKAARLYQVENKLWSLIETELAKEIPLVP